MSVASRLCRRLDGGARQLCAARRRGEAAVRLRRLSSRGARPSPLVSVAVWAAARRTAVRWTAARRGGCPSVASRLCRRLDSGAVSGCALAPLSTRGVRLSPLISSPSGQRRGEAIVRWTAARLAGCALRRGEQLCAGRQLCDGAAFDSRLTQSRVCSMIAIPPRRTAPRAPAARSPASGGPTEPVGTGQSGGEARCAP